MTKTSGYATNHAYMDGKGWKPHAVLAGRNDQTEYRNRYNKEKEFHRDVFVTKARSMLKKGIVGQSAIYS